jgi:hypothetical protein
MDSDLHTDEKTSLDLRHGTFSPRITGGRGKISGVRSNPR